MASLYRRFMLAAAVLPALFLSMSGWARANTIVVNTLDSGSQLAPLCTLEDAVLAADTQAPVNGCAAGTGFSDTIVFIVTGMIFPDNTLTINNSSESLIIEGPAFGGITINGQLNIELIDVEDTSLELENLTLTEGANLTGEGGAVFAGDSLLGIFDCAFFGNEAEEGGAIAAEDSLAEVLNSTFVGNEAFGAGAILNGSALLGVTNTTFSGNAAVEAADIGTASGETGANSTIFANSSSGGNCIGVGDAGYNISDDDSCGFSGTSVNNSTTLHLDPLGPRNNGGPTMTIALETGSQAIDFIPIASCVDLFDAPVTNDQRLFGRPDDGESTCDVGAYESGAVAPIVLAPKSERIQVARSSNPNSDNVNMAFTFTINGDPDCDADDDALNSGINVSLYNSTCATIPMNGLKLMLSPFVVHKINGQGYGTLFQMQPNPSLQQPDETVSARMIAFKTPPAGSCGEWTLNLEVSGLNTSDTTTVNLAGSNPFALVLTNADGDRAGCFDITDAIVGGKIPSPKTPVVRRGVRR